MPMIALAISGACAALHLLQAGALRAQR